MAQPLISVRQLDASGEPLYGQGQNNFLVDIQAVAQIIKTSLLLFEGEWWEDLTDGLPLFQSILGTNNGKKQDAVANIIQSRILTCCPPFITDIENVVTAFTTNREFRFAAVVITQFGPLTINYQPGNAAILPT